MPEQPEAAGSEAALARYTAAEARTFISSVTEVAAGSTTDSALSVLLLATSQILVTGARLGAVEDFVPDERFEPDPGPDPELDALRENLANLFDGVDDYADLVDPVTSAELASGSLVNDLVDTTSALAHGLQHYDAGRIVEALWWWQFSYLSSWGERSAMALRVLHGIVAHVRLDADEDAVAEAEFDALHP